MRGRKGKPTSLDIAYLAGVSQPTVSRALRGEASVHPATRRRILDIARQLNYRLDKAASGLRLATSHTLALLLFEDPTPDDSLINPFFHAMLGAITRASARHGYDLLVSFQQLSPDWHADYEGGHKADGLILLGYGNWLEASPQLQRLTGLGTPFVRWGAALPGQPGISIGSDNCRGGADVTAHLLAHGRRRIAFIGDASPRYPEFFERWRGYCQALAATGHAADPRLQVDAISTEQSGFTATGELLARGVPFDAICAASDLIAIGTLRALREAGLQVPHDIALTGFDDIPIASTITPALTTVQQDTRTAGTLLVDTLIALIHGNLVHNQTIPATLVVRESSRSVT